MSEAKFVTGSTMRHVLVMTSTASIGIMSLFLVDLADIFYLSLLGETEVAAAIGFAGSILFFTTSIGIGLMIAMAALVSHAIGAGRRKRARQIATNVLVYGFILTATASLLIYLSIPTLLGILGAEGRALELAELYLSIIIPTFPLLALGMGVSGFLRAVGDARRAMTLMLITGTVNAILDPILIFGLDMGIAGAASATVIGRISSLIVGAIWISKVHEGFAPFNFRSFRYQIPRISAIALPAVMTNVATPIGTAYVTASMAKFGVSAVAGMAIISKLTPVAFGVIFALSGAVGPIFGQNLGAKKMDRVRQTLKDAMLFMVLYIGFVAVVLFLARSGIVSAFNATGEAANLIILFCTWLAITFIFSGTLFVANASFNNLGRPTYSTFFNWGRNTLGIIPMVYLGAHYYGAEGVLVGQALGSMVFGILALMVARRHVKGLAEGTVTAVQPPRNWRRKLRLIPLWPQITPKN